MVLKRTLRGLDSDFKTQLINYRDRKNMNPDLLYYLKDWGSWFFPVCESVGFNQD